MISRLPLVYNVTLNLPTTLVVVCEIFGAVSYYSCFLTDVASCSHCVFACESASTTEVSSSRLLSLRRLVFTVLLVFASTFLTFLYVRIIIFVSYCFTFNLPKWVLSTQNNFYCTVLAPTHYLFQGLGKKTVVINIAVSSTYPRLLP